MDVRSLLLAPALAVGLGLGTIACSGPEDELPAAGTVGQVTEPTPPAVVADPAGDEAGSYGPVFDAPAEDSPPPPDFCSVATAFDANGLDAIVAAPTPEAAEAAMVAAQQELDLLDALSPPEVRADLSDLSAAYDELAGGLAAAEYDVDAYLATPAGAAAADAATGNDLEVLDAYLTDTCAAEATD